MKYTISQFNKDFPDDNACLERIFKQRFGDLKYCPKCGIETSFYKILARKCYSCKHCGNHIYPLAGTIFHKSPTPLKLWFYTIFLFSASKNGVSAKELQCQLRVTYKTAWRMAKQISELLERTDTDGLDGTIEMDETFIGGRTSLDKKYNNKTPVVGVVERKDKLTVKVTQDTSATTL